jgi:DNA primase
VNELDSEKASTITNILMEEEKYQLHNWEGKAIYVREKGHSIPQLVSETILNLRRHLVSIKINELAEDLKVEETTDKEVVLENIRDYNTLRTVLSEKLNRVL